MGSDKRSISKISNMKLFTFALAAVALAEEKKVPPRTPLDRIEQLRRHIDRLMVDHFSGCQRPAHGARNSTKFAIVQFTLGNVRGNANFLTPTCRMVDPRRKKKNCDTAQRTQRTLSTVSLLVFATGQSDTWRTAAARKITVIWSTRQTSGAQSSMLNLTLTPDWQRAKRSMAWHFGTADLKILYLTTTRL